MGSIGLRHGRRSANESYSPKRVAGRRGRMENGRRAATGIRSNIMEAIAAALETKLHEWKPETSQKVRALVAEIIALADDDMLDIARSRNVEQEVLDQVARTYASP